MTAFEPLGRRARIAVAGQLFSLATLMPWVVISLVGLVSAGDPIVASAAATWGLTALTTLGTIVVIVTSVRWLLPAVRNVASLTGRPSDRTPGWAAWSWFVPGVWWVVPKRVVDELWRSGDGRRTGPVGRLVRWWWLAWLLGWVMPAVANAAWWLSDGDDSPSDAWSVGSDAAAVASIVLSVLVIRGITARQQARAQAASETT